MDKLSIIFFYILLITSFKFINNEEQKTPIEEEDYPNITCGKKNPKSPTDCTKYGTDSKMLCCWISKSKSDKDGKCRLFSDEHARSKFNISGEKEFIDEYWSCGNISNYLNINNILLFIFLIL